MEAREISFVSVCVCQVILECNWCAFNNFNFGSVYTLVKTHPYHSSLVLEMDDLQKPQPRSLHLYFILVLFYIQPNFIDFLFDLLANRKRALWVWILRHRKWTKKDENLSFYSIYGWLPVAFEIMVFAAYCISVQLSIFLR